MKGLTRNWGRPVSWCLVLGLVILTSHGVDSSCSLSVTELWAYSNPATHVFRDSFTKYITSDKGDICSWMITASDKDEVVKVSFPVFDLKNSSDSKKGDCLEIYDGKSTDSTVLAKLCDTSRAGTYTSEGREMFMVYRRGEVEGDRKFTMTFSAKEVMSKAKIIKIAGLVGAALAAIGLAYVVLRATRCCRCLRDKNSSNDNNNRNSSRERDRLTTVVAVDDADNDPNVQIANSQSQNAATPRTNGTSSAVSNENGAQGLAPPSANGAGDLESDETHESDTDSLQDMNEPPPSYESLYLNSEGQPVTPPQYSPPQHRNKHPPRRVHTFN